MLGLHHSATVAFSEQVRIAREKGHHQRAEAEASQPKESKPRSLPQKPRPHSGPGLGRASDQSWNSWMRFSRTGSASKVARSFCFSSWPGAWFVCQGPRCFDKAPEDRAELVGSQINLDLRELRQLSKALHQCGGASSASAGGRQSPPLPVESAVEGVGVDIGRNPVSSDFGVGTGCTENRDPRLGSPERGLWARPKAS